MEPATTEKYFTRPRLLWLSTVGPEGLSFYPHQVLQRKAEVLDIMGDWNQAEAIYRDSLELAEVKADGDFLANARALLAGVMFKKGRYGETYQLLAGAMEYFQKENDRIALGRMIGEMGNVYRAQGDYDKAMEFYHRHLAIAEELDDLRAVSQTVGNMGNVYRVRGQHTQALECYRREAELSDRLGNKQAAALARGNIGLVSMNQGDYQQALKYTSMFMNEAQALGDKRNIGVAYGVLGKIYRCQGRLDDAMSAYRRQLEIMTELGDIRSKTYALGYVGLIYQMTYDYPMAMRYYRRHLALAEELGDRRSVSFAEAYLAGLYMQLMAFPQAWDHFERAINLCRELKLKTELAENLANAAQLRFMQGKPDMAGRLNQEARAAAAEANHQDVIFSTKMLEARLAAREDPAGAAEMIKCLAEGAIKDDQRSEACFQLFKITGSDVYRNMAREMYQNVYEKNRDPAIKLRLDELS